jgi:VanZ family protein
MSLRLKQFIFYWLPLLIFCGFIFIQSSYPSPNNVITFAFSDKLLHVIAYAILGILFFRAYGTLPIKNNLSLLIGLSILSAGLFGLSDEIHQYFVPARNADLWDFIADMIGSLSGVFLYQVWMTWKKTAE